MSSTTEETKYELYVYICTCPVSRQSWYSPVNDSGKWHHLTQVGTNPWLLQMVQRMKAKLGGVIQMFYVFWAFGTKRQCRQKCILKLYFCPLLLLIITVSFKTCSVYVACHTQMNSDLHIINADKYYISSPFSGVSVRELSLTIFEYSDVPMFPFHCSRHIIFCI